jgi:hypothetical protein
LEQDGHEITFTVQRDKACLHQYTETVSDDGTTNDILYDIAAVSMVTLFSMFAVPFNLVLPPLLSYRAMYLERGI